MLTFLNSSPRKAVIFFVIATTTSIVSINRACIDSAQWNYFSIVEHYPAIFAEVSVMSMSSAALSGARAGVWLH